MGVTTAVRLFKILVLLLKSLPRKIRTEIFYHTLLDTTSSNYDYQYGVDYGYSKFSHSCSKVCYEKSPWKNRDGCYSLQREPKYYSKNLEVRLLFGLLNFVIVSGPTSRHVSVANNTVPLTLQVPPSKTMLQSVGFEPASSTSMALIP